jgi:predicted ester cyclase
VPLFAYEKRGAALSPHANHQQRKRNMTTATTQTAFRQMIEALDQGDWATLETHPGMYETLQHFPHLRAAFPDLHHTIDMEFVNGEMIACVMTVRATHSGSFMGIAPTGKEVHFMVIDIDRVVDGKIVQHWGLPDFLSLFQQIGATIHSVSSSERLPEERP